MQITTKELQFTKLPLWEGVQDEPGVKQLFPFSLGWDERGFISQTTPQEIKQKVTDHYAKDEYNFITQPPGFSPWADSLGEREISFILQAYGDIGGANILEVGAGSIYIGEKLASEGAASYLIVDPAIKEKTSNPKIVIRKEYFDKSLFVNQKIDLVVNLNCLEHVIDPVSFLLDLRSVIMHGGKAILVFPDNEEQFINGDINALLHEHLSYFTMEIATKLLTNCGLRVLHSESQFDCLRFLVESSAEKLSVSVAQPMHLLDMFSNFPKSIESANQKLSESLNRGETIALHGATNGLNNFLYLSNLDYRDNLWIFDGDEAKTGKYLPAYKKAIRYSGDNEYYAKVDRVYVTAIGFFSEIKEYLITTHGLCSECIHPLFTK